jgi:RNA polymerase sigma factor (sigma-70 family)
LEEGGPPLDETDLVARAKAGEATAYEALIAQHRAAALRAAAGVLGDQAEAEDAVQEATVKAYRALPRFHDGAPFRPWLLQIVANEARNRRRAAGRRADLARRAHDGGLPVDGASPSPEAAVLAAEQRAVLARAIGDLRAEDRQVIAARYFLELSEAETAEALAWPRGTVKSRLSRALGRLRSGLAVGLLAILALLAAVIAGSADVRTAIADRLGLRGVVIGHWPAAPTPAPTPIPSPTLAPPAGAPAASAPPAGTPPATAPPPQTGTPTSGSPAASAPPAGERLGLGQPVSLAEARTRFGAAIALPADLGQPDELYLREPPAGGMLSLVYRPRPGLPAAGSTGVGLLVSQFRAALAPEFLGKGLGPGSRVEQLSVGDGRAIWISGQPHAFFYRDRAGQPQPEDVRLAGSVLLWERGELTLRLEAALERDEAVRLAATIR